MKPARRDAANGTPSRSKIRATVKPSTSRYHDKLVWSELTVSDAAREVAFNVAFWAAASSPVLIGGFWVIK